MFAIGFACGAIVTVIVGVIAFTYWAFRGL